MGYTPTHPHNAYLDMLIDSGVAGLIPVMVMYGALFWVSASLCRDRSNPLFQVAGAASLAAVVALLLMGVSGQTLFPKENAQMAWCLYAIAIRVWVDRRRGSQTAFAPQGSGRVRGWR